MTQLVAAIYLPSWNHLQAEKTAARSSIIARAVHEFAATVIIASRSNFAEAHPTQCSEHSTSSCTIVLGLYPRAVVRISRYLVPDLPTIHFQVHVARVHQWK